jgi:hypothetical protein
MKHGRGIKGLDDKSSGMDILIAEAFAKIKPTDPLILANKQDSSGMSLTEAESETVCLFATGLKKLFIMNR